MLSSYIERSTDRLQYVLNETVEDLIAEGQNDDR